MASKNRKSVTLKCTECGEENYITSINKKNDPDRIEKKKFCSRCNKMTVHKEKK
ncbi:MAG: 50S ribosomal protein L33 [Erysipelotrichaceae bacterium]|nr:50S ribosomal protein L33 [Erysipelotrichaceae bacterium]